MSSWIIFQKVRCNFCHNIGLSLMKISLIIGWKLPLKNYKMLEKLIELKPMDYAHS